MNPDNLVNTQTIEVQITREAGFEDLPLPHYQTNDAAGVDLYAAIENSIYLKPGEVRLVSTGLRMAIPKGFEGQVRPRSGLALKYGIGILNSPGTVDADYRGVVGVILYNFGNEPFRINRGDRIAQMIYCKVEKARLRMVSMLPESSRSEGGFGSTGR